MFFGREILRFIWSFLNNVLIYKLMRMVYFVIKKNNNNNVRYGGYIGCNKRVFFGSFIWEVG